MDNEYRGSNGYSWFVGNPMESKSFLSIFLWNERIVRGKRGKLCSRCVGFISIKSWKKYDDKNEEGVKLSMNTFMTKTLWFDFRNNTVYEEIMDFPKFSKLMKLDVENEIQILTYERY